MEEIKKYNSFRIEAEALFKGLPLSAAYLVNILISRFNPITGIVEKISYRSLATLLCVDAAPGRKNSGIPTKQAVRDFLRTIETQCGDHFQIISEGQSLKIKFPTLPGIFISHFSTPEVPTVGSMVSHTQEPIDNISKTELITGSKNTESRIDFHTESPTLCPIIAINACANKPKQNNNNNNFSKSPISDSFFPTSDTIARALDQGFDRVEDREELQAFIDHNKASGSLWADFNPIYLRWLAQSKHRAEEQRKKLDIKTTHFLGRVNDGTVSKTDKRSVSERVIARHEACRGVVFCEQTRRFGESGGMPEDPQPIQYIDIDSLGAIN